MRLSDQFIARGHPNILATHPTTFEITKDDWLTRRGDCIIAVQSAKGLVDLPTELRNLCRNSNARIMLRLEAGGISDFIEGRGNPHLTFSHPTEIVGRKSSHVSDRTLMVGADKAACDIRRDLVKMLTLPSTLVKVKISVEF